MLHVILIGGRLFMLMPFLWMISTSLKAQGDIFIFPPQWIPDPPRWNQLRAKLDAQTDGTGVHEQPQDQRARDCRHGLYVVARGVCICQAGVSRAASSCSSLLLATLMIPVQVTLIPLFILFKWINWIDTHWPLIVPAILTNAYGVFLLRQFFKSLPDELGDAGRIDGCNPLQIYWHIYLPLAQPALVTLGIFAFMYHWNEFLLPLIYLNTQTQFTLPLMLASFQNGYTTEWALLMAAATIALIPVIIVYIFGQRYFVQGIALTGLKG